MPITFEEVTADIRNEPQGSEAGGAPAPKKGGAGEDAAAELERTLRLMGERHARVSAE